MPGNTQNFNRYSYCLNNPLKYTDPSGNLTLAEFWGIAEYLWENTNPGGTGSWSSSNPNNATFTNGPAFWSNEGSRYGSSGGGSGGTGGVEGSGSSNVKNLQGWFWQTGFGKAIMWLGGWKASFDGGWYQRYTKEPRERFEGGRLYEYVYDYENKKVSRNDENKAYLDMWRYSFDRDDYKNKDAEAVIENGAYITNKGILVFPNKNNGLKETDFRHNGLELRVIKGRYMVYFNNEWLKIIGTIHTHPNDNTGTYINGKDLSVEKPFGYIFVIGWDGLHASWRTADGTWVQQPICDLNTILNNISVYYNLNLLK